MPLLTDADYPAIRAAIDIELAVEDVPDDVIALPIYAGSGEAAVLALVPGAADLTGDDAERVKLAAILFTAALLVERLPRYVEERTEHYSYRKATDGGLSVAQTASDLRARAKAAIVGLVEIPTPRRTASYFGIARAGR